MKRFLQTSLGLAVGVGLMWFLFRNTNMREMADSLRGISIPWLLASTAVLIGGLFLRVQRWSYIVRTDKFVSFRHMFSATQIGFMANFILPARLGEVIRAMVLGKLAPLPFSKAFAMVALDRVTDLFGLIAVIFVTLFAYTPTGQVIIPKSVFGRELSISPASIRTVEIEMIIGLVGLVIALVFLYINQRFVLRVSDTCVGAISKRLAARIHTILQNFADGLHVFRSAGDMAKALGFSLLTWATFLICMLFLMLGFRLHFPWYTPFVMEAMLAVAISVPGPPGFLGQFQYPIVAALMMLVPDISIAKALAFSMVAYVINLIPVIAVGVFCLSWEKFAFFELSREGSQLKSTMRSEPGEPPAS